MKKGTSNIGWYVSIIGLLFIGGGITYALIKKKQLKKENGKTQSNKEDNFKLLVTKTGVKDITPQTDKVVLAVDSDSKKYNVISYNNNRFSLKEKDDTRGGEYVEKTKGNYSEGGKELLTDGGKRAYSDSIIGNVKKIIEQIK